LLHATFLQHFEPITKPEITQITKKKAKIESARNALSLKLSVKQVATITGLSVDEVESLK